MTINLIAAVALDGSIGANGKLLWKIPADLNFYKAKTLDNVVVIGEVTFDTLPRIALKNRTHVVVSKKYSEMEPYPPEEQLENVFYEPNPKEALKKAIQLAGDKGCDVFIGGGQTIYEQLIIHCDFMFITWVDKVFVDMADTYFPIIDIMNHFELVSESKWHGKHAKAYPPYKFTVYKNRG